MTFVILFREKNVLEFLFIILYDKAMNIFEKCALKTPDILLPKKEIDITLLFNKYLSKEYKNITTNS